MKTTKLSTAILIGSAVIGSSNCEAQVEKDSLELANNPNKENQLEKKFPIIKKDSIELEIRLRELAETEYKGELRGGAMCYIPITSYDKPYICPICKKTTLNFTVDKDQIESIRAISQKIKQLGYDVILDESEFCEHCRDTKANENSIVVTQSPDKTKFEFRKNDRIEYPVLIFKIRFSKNSKYHVVKSNFEFDYLILWEFLNDNDKYNAGSEGELPLHMEIDVIKKMTGLGSEIITSKPKNKKK